MLHSSEDLSFSCVLSSMNLYRWDEWKDTDAIFESRVFLDCLISYFLEKAKGINGLQKILDFTEYGRAVGLGVLGFSSYLQKKRIPYESLEAQFLNTEIFSKLRSESDRASRWMAEEMGEAPWCKGYGLRGTHSLACAPTKSTAILQGGLSESVSPEPGMVFEQPSAAGGLFRISAEFYHLMKERGMYNGKMIDSIVDNNGGVQHLDWLSPQEKEVFKTAFEVDQFVILRYASQRQKYIDQGQSLNFFVSQDGDEDRIAQLLSDCFLNEDILSVYYFYSRSGVTISSSCEVCEA